MEHFEYMFSDKEEQWMVRFPTDLLRLETEIMCEILTRAH